MKIIIIINISIIIVITHTGRGAAGALLCPLGRAGLPGEETLNWKLGMRNRGRKSRLGRKVGEEKSNWKLDLSSKLRTSSFGAEFRTRPVPHCRDATPRPIPNFASGCPAMPRHVCARLIAGGGLRRDFDGPSKFTNEQVRYRSATHRFGTLPTKVLLLSSGADLADAGHNDNNNNNDN